jgi:hypothetical protein
MTATDDRRRQRSQDPLVALHYQLAYTRNEERLDAIVVADDCGGVMAAAGAWAACEELAAYAPILSRGAWTEPGAREASRVAELQGQVDIQPVMVDGSMVLLCTRGRRARAGAMDRAAAGVARILRAA